MPASPSSLQNERPPHPRRACRGKDEPMWAGAARTCAAAPQRALGGLAANLLLDHVPQRAARGGVLRAVKAPLTLRQPTRGRWRCQWFSPQCTQQQPARLAALPSTPSCGRQISKGRCIKGTSCFALCAPCPSKVRPAEPPPAPPPALHPRSGAAGCRRCSRRRGGPRWGRCPGAGGGGRRRRGLMALGRPSGGRIGTGPRLG
jgi:hypothetical protein